MHVPTDIPTIYHLKQNCPLRHFSRSLKYLFRLFVYNVTQDTYVSNPTVYKATQKTTMKMSVNEFTDLHKLAAHRVVNKMYRNGTTTAVVYRTVLDGLILYVLASNACGSTPCQNGATCEEAQGGYSCTCIAGFEGNDCETGMQIIVMVKISAHAFHDISRNKEQWDCLRFKLKHSYTCWPLY